MSRHYTHPSEASPLCFNRQERCTRKHEFQPVPGRTSFRQEWPIRLCDYVECASDGTAVSNVTHVDPCMAGRAEEEEEEGPLERFDQSVRGYLDSDVMGREVPQLKHSTVHPSIISRNVKDVMSTTEDFAAEDVTNRAFARKLASIEKHFMYEQALLIAEEAAEAAPPELVEEAALASSRGYTMTLEGDRKPISTEGDTIVEVISYLGITKPMEEYSYGCGAFP